MEFSRSDVERAFEQVPLSDGFARELLDGRILDALAERIFTPANASADTPFPAYETERERRLITRSTLLTYAVLGDLQAGNFEVETPYPLRPIGQGFEQMVIRYGAVGMVESLRSGRPEFGVSVKLPPWFMDEFGFSERFYPQRASIIRIGRLDLRLPLSVAIGVDVPHALPHPAHATAACFATRGDTTGVVVAGHSVQFCCPGDHVPLDNGRVARLVQSGYRPIDAAFLEVDDAPVGLIDLPVLPFPTTGDEVVVHTRRGREYRKVAQVNNSLVSPKFSDYSIVLYLDASAHEGDSGALIRLARSGEAVAVYTGAHEPLRPRAQGALGTGQNFAQAIYTLGLTPKQ